MDQLLGKRKEPLLVRELSDYFPHDKIELHKVNILSSPMGCGKTHAISHFIAANKFNKILFITNRVSLAETTSLSFGCTNYLHYSNGPINCSSNIVITINSIRRLVNINEYDLIILDEFNSTLDMMGSSIVDTEDIVMFFYNSVVNIDNASSKRTFIISDAILPKDTKQLIKRLFVGDNFGEFEFLKSCFYPNVKRLPFENVLIYDNADNIFISIIKGLAEKKKIVLLTNCTKLCSVFVGLCRINCVELFGKLNLKLKEHLDFTYQIFSSDTKDKVYKAVQSNFKDVHEDLLIFSPVMDSGISVDNLEIDDVYAVFCGITNTVSSMIQMCGRIRKNKSKTIKIGLVKNNNESVLPSFDEMRELDKSSCRRNLKLFIKNINCDKETNRSSIKHYITRSDINNENAVAKVYDKLDSYNSLSVELIKRIYENKRKLQSSFNDELDKTFTLNHPEIKVLFTPYDEEKSIVCNNVLKLLVNRIKLSQYNIEYSRFANEDNYTASVLSLSPCMEKLYNLCSFGAKKQFPSYTEVFVDKVYMIYLLLPDKIMFDNHLSMLGYNRLLSYIEPKADTSSRDKVGCISGYTDLYIKLFKFFGFDCSFYGIGILNCDIVFNTIIIYAKYDELLNIINDKDYFSFYCSKSIDPSKIPKKRTDKKVTGDAVNCLCDIVLKLFAQIGYVFDSTNQRPRKENIDFLQYNDKFDYIVPSRPRIYEYSASENTVCFIETFIKYAYTAAYNTTKNISYDILLDGLYTYSTKDDPSCVSSLVDNVNQVLDETKKEVTSCLWLKENNHRIVRQKVSKKQKKASSLFSLKNIFSS